MLYMEEKSALPVEAPQLLVQVCLFVVAMMMVCLLIDNFRQKCNDLISQLYTVRGAVNV